MADHRRIARNAWFGRRLQAIAVTFPCKFTLRLFERQVSKVERLVGPPPSHVAETWGRLRFPAKSPHALIHKDRIKKEERAAEFELARTRLKELIESVHSWN